MIPKTIHYCWFGGKNVPRYMERYMQSWKKYCPDYEIRCWSESNYDVKKNLFVKSAYEAKAWAFVSDYARLDVIFRYGGIYLDTDVELLKGLDAFLEHSAFFGIQQNGFLCSTGLGFGAEKGNKMVREMMELYHKLEYTADIKETIACPRLNHSILERNGYQFSDNPISLSNVVIYPPRYFDPYPSGRGKNLMCEDTVSIHHYAASWTGIGQRAKRRLAWWIGEKNILSLKNR